MTKEYMGSDTKVNIEGTDWKKWTGISWLILGTSNGPFECGKEYQFPQNAVNCWMCVAHYLFNKYCFPRLHCSEHFNGPFHHGLDAS
jgi:hypothetical protein